MVEGIIVERWRWSGINVDKIFVHKKFIRDNNYTKRALLSYTTLLSRAVVSGAAAAATLNYVNCFRSWGRQ